jgi:hypothetical protein
MEFPTVPRLNFFMTLPATCHDRSTDELHEQCDDVP